MTGCFFLLALCLFPTASRASVISGIVRDFPSGRHLEGATVILGKNRGELMDSLVTDTSGAYRFTASEGCGFGCWVTVRKRDYWAEFGYTFLLESDKDTVIDENLERIHTLVILPVQAEDTTRTIAGAWAVLVFDRDRTLRGERIDSSGRLEFGELRPTPEYRVTVAAPGRQPRFLTYRLSAPSGMDTARVALDTGMAPGSKSVHGTLLTRKGEPLAGAQVFVGCRTDPVWVDFFAYADGAGRFAVQGLPLECARATLRMVYASDSLDFPLTGADTQVEWAPQLPTTPVLRRAHPVAALPIARWRGRDLRGRMLSAGRARSRP